jgi:hypothetical protein
VLGEEVVRGRSYSEPIIPLSDSFVIFPERRRGPHVPCIFILPPLPFPELEGKAANLGISEIISVSPSPAVDTFIRESFRFPLTSSLGTLLVGVNLSPPNGASTP